MRQYPWATWFNRSNKVILKQHKHFDCQVHSMVAQIRSAARQHKVKVSVHVNDNTIQLLVKGRKHK